MLRVLYLLLILSAVISDTTNISRFVKPEYPLARSTSDYLLILSNDGGIYKFDPASREILWHRTLRMDLMSVNMTDSASTDGYFLPDLNGDFVYVSSNQNIIEVQREDLEKLLNLCFDTDQKHFLYQTSSYYILEIVNGALQTLQEFLKTRQSINHSGNAVIRIDRKYLKSIKESDEKNWNVISSHVHLLTVNEFLSQPKLINIIQTHPFYNFSRLSSHTIRITDKQSKLSYELDSDESFIDLFSFNTGSFVKHKLDQKEQQPGKQRRRAPGRMNTKELVLSNIKSLKVFDSSKNFKINDQWECTNNSNDATDEPSLPTDLSSMEFCINSFRVLKQSSEGNALKQLEQDNIREFKDRFTNKPTRELDISSVTLVSILVAAVIFIVVGVKALQKKIVSMSSTLQQSNGELARRIQDMEIKLVNFNEINKHANSIYTIDYSSDSLYESDNVNLREATFLGKRAYVYILNKPVSESLIAVVNRIYSDQPNYIIKVLYLFQNDLNWCVFVEPISTTLNDKVGIESPMPRKAQNHLKESILHLINNLISNKYQIHCLSPDHFIFDKDNHLKFNVLAPNIELWQPPEQIISLTDPLAQINFMIGLLIYYIYSGGNLLYRHKEDEPHSATKANMLALKKSEAAVKALQSDIALEDLLDKLIQEDRKIESIPIKQITQHFYFWDTTRKLSFVNEFSNYMETFVEESKVRKFEQFCHSNGIIEYPWSNRLHKQVLQQICTFRKYDYQSVRDLIRMIRNKTAHFMEISEAVQEIVGRTKEDLCMYFLERYPKLLCFMFVYTKKKKWKL